MKFRKKPVEVEAMPIAAGTSDDDFLDPNTRTIAEISGWMLGHGFRDFKVHGGRRPFGIAIETLEGVMVASPGDWIIRGVQGEFYPCKPDIFEATYETGDDLALDEDIDQPMSLTEAGRQVLARDELDDHIEESMKDHEYAAAAYAALRGDLEGLLSRLEAWSGTSPHPDSSSLTERDRLRTILAAHPAVRTSTRGDG